MDELKPDPKVLLALVKTRMPYGKYKGRLICDVPDYYIGWMKKKGALPKGKLGELLLNVYEIKTNNLGYILDHLKYMKPE